MFDNKNHKDELSSDELELMKMIKEYERDEAEEQLHEADKPRNEHTEDKPYKCATDTDKDTALIHSQDHTKVLSRDQLDDKTLTIMPVGNVVKEESTYHTQDLDISQSDDDAKQDDDPRFELHRKKDKKQKQKKAKKPKHDDQDEKLNKAVIITIVIASIVAVIAGGFLVYNSFFRDKKANDDKVTEVTKKKEKKKTDKKQETNKTEPPKDDHTAEISLLQKLIEQERTKYNDNVNEAKTLQEQLNAYNTSVTALQGKVTEAQQAIDNAGGDDNVTDDMRTALDTANKNLADFLKKNATPPTQEGIEEWNRKARANQDQITNYQNQISQYQNNK